MVINELFEEIQGKEFSQKNIKKDNF